VQGKTKFQKRTKTIFISLLVLFLGAMIFLVFLFSKSYPEDSTLTQNQVLTATTVEKDDSPFVRLLKNSALDDYLATGAVTKVKALPDNKLFLEKIAKGQMSFDEFNSNKPKIQQMLHATDVQMNNLQNEFTAANLSLNSQKLEHLSTGLSTSQLSAYFDQMQTVADSASKAIDIYESDSNSPLLPNILTSITDLTTAQSNIDQFTDFINKVKNYNTTSPNDVLNLNSNNPLIQENDSILLKLQNYATQKQQIDDKIKTLKDFQTKDKDSQQLLKNSIPLPNLIGKTVAQAQELLSSTSIPLKISTKNYDKNSIINKQTPDPSQYDRIMQNQTIQVEAETSSTGTSSSSSS